MSKEQKSGSRPNLEDVARIAGVSAMTASRALRGAPRVSKVTAARVREAADSLGYRPNPLVQTLMASIRDKRVIKDVGIAWVTTFKKKRYPPSLQRVEQGARERAEALGFNLERICLNDPELTANAVARIFRVRGLHAAIIAPLSPSEYLAPMPWNDFAFSTIGSSLGKPALHYTMSHHYHAMYDLLGILTKRGYRRAGFLLRRDTDTRMEHAPLMVFEHHRGESSVRAVSLEFYDGWVPEDYQRWVRSHSLDVVVADYSSVADSLVDAGLRVPEEVGFATLSWRKDRKEHSGMRQRFAALGAGAVDLVAAQLHRNEYGIPPYSKAVLIECEWMDGATLPNLIASDSDREN